MALVKKRVEYTITKCSFFNEWCKHSQSERNAKLFQFVSEKHDMNNITKVSLKNVKAKIAQISQKYHDRWLKHGKDMEKMQKNSNWLFGYIRFKVTAYQLAPPPTRLLKPSSVKKISLDTSQIRYKVMSSISESMVIPSLQELMDDLKEDYVDTEMDSLTDLVYKMGYSLKKIKDGRSVLMENPNIVLKRKQYVSELNRYQYADRNIVYVDETCIIQSPDDEKSERLAIIHACDEKGLLDGALEIFQPGSYTGDCHGELMDYATFRNWVENKLKPNLLPSSIVVMNNATYHCEQVDEIPTMFTPKTEIHRWLQDQGIKFSPSYNKAELLNLINLKENEPKYAIDELLDAQNHTVLRLPPYHEELNPMGHMWKDIKTLMKNHIYTTLEEKVPLLTNLFSEFIQPKWKNYMAMVQEVEDDYCTYDREYDSKVDHILAYCTDDADKDSTNRSPVDSSDDEDMIE